MIGFRSQRRMLFYVAGLVLVGAAMLLVLRSPTKVFADNLTADLAHGCPAQAGPPSSSNHNQYTHWAYKLTYNSSTGADGNGTATFYGQAFVCGNSGYDITQAQFYKFAAASGNVTGFSPRGGTYGGTTNGFYLGDGNTSSGNFSTISSETISFHIPPGQCQTVSWNYSYGAYHGAYYDRNGAYHDGIWDGHNDTATARTPDICAPVPNWSVSGTTTAPSSAQSGNSIKFTSTMSNDSEGGTAHFSYGPRYFYSNSDQTGAYYAASHNEIAPSTTGGGILAPGASYSSDGASPYDHNDNGATSYTVTSVDGSYKYICGTVAFSPYNSSGSLDGRSPAVCVPIDHLPALTAPATCTDGFKLSATDDDYSTTTPAANRKVRVDVYEDHDASGYPASAPYRQYTTYSVAGGVVSVSLADLEAGNTGSAGTSYPPGTAASHPGRSTDWASHTFYIYAINVDSSGTEIGGNTEKTVTVGPCATIACAPSQTTFPGSFEANAAPSFVVAVQASGVTTPPPTPPGFGVTVKGPGLTGPVVTTTPTTTTSPYLVPYGSGTTTLVSQPISFTPTGSGTYYLTWNWYDSGHTASNSTTNSTGTTKLCGDHGTTVTKPYFNVLGGDVTAGSGFSTATGSCTQLLTAGVKSWNNNNNPSGNFIGAGSQLATFSLGNIESFATSINAGVGLSNVGTPVGASTSSPHNLSFANRGSSPLVNVNDSAGQYGGGFGYLPCIKDYYTSSASGSHPFTPGPYLGDLGGGVLALESIDSLPVDPTTNAATYNSGTLHINNPSDTKESVSPQKQITIRVSGDVYIDDDLDYGPYALGSAPRLNIYATGNIYVSGAVGELHGLYVAGGKFATCYDGSLAHPAESTDFDTCNNPLTIYGSVLAKQIDFDRTFSSLNAASTRPAESIHYTPELWLPSTGTGTTLNCSPKCNYESITSLPPVL